MTSLGFDQPLYILPFDHRGSLQVRMLNRSWRFGSRAGSLWKQ